MGETSLAKLMIALDESATGVAVSVPSGGMVGGRDWVDWGYTGAVDGNLDGVEAAPPRQAASRMPRKNRVMHKVFFIWLLPFSFFYIV